jgi:hypothetical protein
MAARIPVVVSQSVRRENIMIELEESLVTELMFTNGLDATLIGPLQHISLDSTDHLCLEGFKGPFALFTWGTASLCREQLSRLKIDGDVVDHGEGPLRSASFGPRTTRWIDHFQIDLSTPISTWVEALKQLLKSRETRTFSISSLGLIGKKSPSGGPASEISLIVPPTTGTAESAEAVRDAQATKPSNAKPDTLLNAATSDPTPILITSPIPDISDDEADWPHLEDLMGELDRADV